MAGKGSGGAREGRGAHMQRQTGTCPCWGTCVCVCPERKRRKCICLIGTQDNSKKSSVCWAHLLCHVILVFLRLSQEFSQYGCEVGVIPTFQRWKLRLREAR